MSEKVQRQGGKRKAAGERRTLHSSPRTKAWNCLLAEGAPGAMAGFSYVGDHLKAAVERRKVERMKGLV